MGGGCRRLRPNFWATPYTQFWATPYKNLVWATPSAPRVLRGFIESGPRWPAIFSAIDRNINPGVLMAKNRYLRVPAGTLPCVRNFLRYRTFTPPHHTSSLYRSCPCSALFLSIFKLFNCSSGGAERKKWRAK
jgi:hypothetical protein